MTFRDLCQVRLARRVSATSWRMYRGMFVVFSVCLLCGVDFQAGSWTNLVKCCTASLMSSGDFNRSLRFTLLPRCRWREVQSIFFVASLGGGDFFMIVVLRLTITGVWSKVRSALVLLCSCFLLFHLLQRSSINQKFSWGRLANR
jgi:hypothetical protein